MRCVWLCVFLLACTTSDKNGEDVDGTDVVDTPDDTDETDSPADSDSDPPDGDSDTPDTDETDDSDVDTDDSDVDTDDSDVDTDDSDVDTDDSDVDTDDSDVDTDDSDVDTDDSDVDTDDSDVDTDDSDVDIDTADTDDTGVMVPSVISDVQMGVYQPGDAVVIPQAVITAEGVGFVFVQDVNRSGPWRGVYVVPPSGAGLFRAGTIVSIDGTVRETTSASGSRTEIVATSWSNVGNAVVPLAAPVELSELADPVRAERWEGVRVSLADVRVWEGTSSRSPIIIGDANDQLVVDPTLFHMGETSYGDTIDELTGIVDWRDDRFVLMPIRLSSVTNHLRFQAPVDMVVAGDIVVTEWMPFAAASVTGDRCSDPATSGQYIEILNLSSTDINLDGMFVFDFTTNQTTQVRQSVPMPAGARIVGFSGGDANCYGIAADFTYDVHTSGTQGIGLFSNQVLLDQINTSLFTISPGVAIELTETNPSASRNDDPLNWCDAITTIDAGTTDLGTPGLVNDCP